MWKWMAVAALALRVTPCFGSTDDLVNELKEAKVDVVCVATADKNGLEHVLSIHKAARPKQGKKPNILDNQVLLFTLKAGKVLFASGDRIQSETRWKPEPENETYWSFETWIFHAHQGESNPVNYQIIAIDRTVNKPGDKPEITGRMMGSPAFGKENRTIHFTCPHFTL